jgi:polyisoprenoid-binding protein YceI
MVVCGRIALVLATLFRLASTASGDTESRSIDPAHSTLDVFVDKSGLLSAFADNHVIRAPIHEGRINDEGDLAVELTVRSAALTVMDPGLSADKRADVAMRMHGPDVLDSARYPTIRFVSHRITAEGPNRWRVAGELTLHGVSRPVSGLVISRDGRYRGSTSVRQRDFDIRPISIAGGAVRVKDEVRIEFDIVTINR